MLNKSIVIIFLFLTRIVYAQDVEQIIKNKPLQLTGSINANATFYSTNSDGAQRDPFTWLINGNFNLSLYGVIDAPISFLFSKDNKSLDANNDAFKQFGISPKYKSVTLHLGYRNMDFSQYTMSGITFLGTGVEYEPMNSIVKLKMFYGRFASAKQYKSISAYDPNALYDLPVYERWGYGTMITVGKKGQFFDLILFKAEDNNNSISVPDSIGVKPAENFVIGINTRNSITKNLNVKLNYSLSAFSTDTRQPEIEQKTYTYSNNLGFLFTPRTSSQFNNSFQLAMDYNFNFAMLGLSYKRVDPEYQSLGISFINNDIEEFSANVATSLFKNKVSVSGNFGTQKNNLDHSQITTNKRFITSFNCTYLVNKKLNITASYSNFSSSATPTQIQLVDSIKYTQATSNFGITSNYNFGTNDIQQGINLLASYQNGNTLNQSGTQVTDVSNSFLNTNLMYRLGFIPNSISLFLSVNYSIFNTSNLNTTSYGPTLGISKMMLKNKLNIGLNTTYLITDSNTDNSSLLNLRLFSDYKINKHHAFRISASFLNKTSDINTINQFQGNIAYNYIL
ncbi:MAG: hypothetical protein A2W99_14350 [Bacteroidetes bacterium GWF2_33_16]|nr:MAG: hypothetical protein A2X00_06280 [Bacteroidetes bacterium GWE2_32_14]OFY04806.1 MAG: hypothetical protein A2W99_14350 [Bacteroidetes bacterium GWF2_33_16]